MHSATPPNTNLRRIRRSLCGHPARWIAPLLMLVALGTGYVVCAGQPEPHASDIPTVRLESAPSADAVARLTRTTELAQAELDKSTAQLATLKTLSESAGDVAALQGTADEVQRELQQAEHARNANRELLQSLQPVQEDPARISAVSDKLLESQSAVRQLKEAWTAAHARTSELLVTLLPDHPRVQACRAEEEEIGKRLCHELSTIVHDLLAEQTRLDAQVDTLAKKSAAVQTSTQRFAAIQTDYHNLAALVRRQTADLKRAQQRLSTAQTNPVVEPVPGSGDDSAHPRLLAPARGPGRTLLIAAALVGGVFISLALFMFRGSSVSAGVVPPANRPTAGPVPVHTAPTSTSPTPPLPAVGSMPTPQRTTGLTLAQALDRLRG